MAIALQPNSPGELEEDTLQNIFLKVPKHRIHMSKIDIEWSIKQLKLAQNRRAQGIPAEEMDGYIAEATHNPLKQLWLEQRLFPFGAPYHRSGWCQVNPSYFDNSVLNYTFN